MKALAVIDMQRDFINKSVLGNDETEAVVEKVVKLIETSEVDVIYVTYDTHSENYLMSQEGHNLPVIHCIKGSEGWKLDERIENALETRNNLEVIRLEKPTFGSTLLGESVRTKEISEIELCGVCTDICVISNAMVLKAFNPELKIAINSKACAGVSVESHENALKAMAACQMEIK